MIEKGLSENENAHAPSSLPSTIMMRRLTTQVRNEIARRGFPAGPADRMGQ